MIPSGQTIHDMVTSRPKDMAPLDAYTASEMYQPTPAVDAEKQAERVAEA